MRGRLKTAEHWSFPTRHHRKRGTVVIVFDVAKGEISHRFRGLGVDLETVRYKYRVLFHG